MLPYETMLLFLGTTMLLCLTPAADNTLVFTQSAFQGRMAGIAVTAGFCTGLTIQIAVVVAGLAVIIKSYTILFTTFKVIGALYLAYIALQAFKLRSTITTDTAGQSHISLFALYRRGALMNILNPMVPLFLMIYYPPFIKTATGTTSEQLIQLGVLNVVAALCVFGTLSFLGEKIGERIIRYKRVQMIIRCCACFFIVVTAVVLLIQ